MSRTTPTIEQQQSKRGSDYVYFERTAAGMSDDAVPRAKTAQAKLEHFYTVSVQAAVERNQRSAASLSGVVSDLTSHRPDASSSSASFRRT